MIPVISFSAQGLSGVICHDGQFEIQADSAFVEAKKFSASRLRGELRRLVTVSDSGEFYGTISADRKFLEKLSAAEIGTVHSLSSNALTTSAPLAYLFKVGKNEFFQYRNAEGHVQWVLVKGENVFDRSVAGVPVLYAGQAFARPNEPCSHAARKVVFVIPNLRELEIPQIREILKYYDSLLKSPKQLLIWFFDSFAPASLATELRLPVLLNGIAQSTRSGPAVSVNYLRLPNLNRITNVYQDGKLVFREDMPGKASTKTPVVQK
ncbi:MAG TPA: hypothetical protein VGL91_10585 [Acidobacteriota bacterium]